MTPSETLDTGAAVYNDKNEIIGLVTGKGLTTGKLHVARLNDIVTTGLRDKAIDDYLDKMGAGAKFSDLAAAADAASDRASLVAAAQALHDWQKEKGK